MSTELESVHTARTGPGAPGRLPLSRKRIIETAIDFVDRCGLPALTMLRLGKELGVEAMALYRYVNGSSKASSSTWSPSCSCAPITHRCSRPTAGRPTSAGSHTASAN
jgi:hypothetical protein